MFSRSNVTDAGYYSCVPQTKLSWTIAHFAQKSALCGRSTLPSITRIFAAPQTCGLCGTQFNVTSNSKGLFCSPTCRNKARRKYHTAAESLEARREGHRRSGVKKRAKVKAARAIRGAHTPAQWKDLCERARYRCSICKKKKPLVRDHIRPLSKGGADDITNIQPLCVQCNQRKRAKITQLL